MLVLSGQRCHGKIWKPYFNISPPCIWSVHSNAMQMGAEKTKLPLQHSYYLCTVLIIFAKN